MSLESNNVRTLDIIKFDLMQLKSQSYFKQTIDTDSLCNVILSSLMSWECVSFMCVLALCIIFFCFLDTSYYNCGNLNLSLITKWLLSACMYTLLMSFLCFGFIHFYNGLTFLHCILRTIELNRIELTCWWILNLLIILKIVKKCSNGNYFQRRMWIFWFI